MTNDTAPAPSTPAEPLGLQRFRNAIRIMYNLDGHELVAAGAIEGCGQSWDEYLDNPYRWLMRADDAAAVKLWGLIESQQPPELRESAPVMIPLVGFAAVEVVSRAIKVVRSPRYAPDIPHPRWVAIRDVLYVSDKVARELAGAVGLDPFEMVSAPNAAEVVHAGA